MTSAMDGTDDHQSGRQTDSGWRQPLDRKTRRHCRRLARALHTDRVQAALERAGVNPMTAMFVQARLHAAGDSGRPLLDPSTSGIAASFRRVLDATAPIRPRETATVRRRIASETDRR